MQLGLIKLFLFHLTVVCCKYEGFPTSFYPLDHCKHRVEDEKWDFIVVGAGSGGAIAAKRLAEVAHWRILLIEAGGDPPLLWSLPIGTLITLPSLEKEAEWGYGTTPLPNICRGFVNSSCNLRRAKVLGGCSSNNYMQYVRGNPKDYDGWRDMGNPGWGFKDVLPYFKKLENFNAYPISDAQSNATVSSLYHSKGGPLGVNLFAKDAYVSNIEEATILAYQSMGIEGNIDVNGESQFGIGRTQASVNQQKFRSSTAEAYLSKIPKNMKICKYSLVDQLILKGNQAVGVRFFHGNRAREIYATKEVILSAGTIGSPAILERSGIGKPDVLSKLGINTNHILDGVGENLQDHYSIPGNILAVTIRPTGPPTIFGLGLSELIAYTSTKNDGGPPNVQVQHGIAPFAILADRFQYSASFKKNLISDLGHPLSNILLFAPTMIHPESRGSVHIIDKDPNSNPEYLYDPFSIESDQEAAIKAIKITNKIAESTQLTPFQLRNIPLKACTEDGVKPMSNEYFKCVLQYGAASLYHIVGTCAMGPKNDPKSVVSHELLVHGIEGLRIVDGSVLPRITRGNTNAPIMMIAEKAADMIKDKHVRN